MGFRKNELLLAEMKIMKLLSRRDPDLRSLQEHMDRLVAMPGAEDACDLGALHGEWAMALGNASRLEDAIDKLEKAHKLGWKCVPDCRADIAHYYLRLGRREEADALFALLREEYPDDIWLFNAAGFAYQHAGDHEEAARWFTRGIEIGLATGDPESLLDQLAEGRAESRKALDQPPDEWDAKVREFLTAPPKRETHIVKGSKTVPTPGRNDPCPCGSGRKHKKCCLGKS